MRTTIISCLAMAACATAPQEDVAGFDRFERFDVKSYGDEKPENATPTEAWSSQDDPSLFDDNLEYDVDALPMPGEACVPVVPSGLSTDDRPLPDGSPGPGPPPG